MSDEQTAYDKLNDQQKIFVDALIENITERAVVRLAAGASGYDYAYARRLVTESHIKEAYEERESELRAASLYSLASLRNDLIALKNFNMQSAVYQDKNGNQFVKMVDANAANQALDKLGKMMGAYTDKVEHSGEVQGIVGIEIVYSNDIDEE